jgi:hypothetical protein
MTSGEPSVSVRDEIPRWVWWLVWIAVPVAMGLVSIKIGGTFSWDVRNYHYYNGFALIEDRMGHDLAPAARQTFHNPVLDFGFYLVYRYLYGHVGGFLLGFVHGLNFPLLFILAMSVLRLPRETTMKVLVGLTIATAGVLHRTFLVQLGGAAQDNIVSFFVLAALIVLLIGGRLDAVPERRAALRVAAAGCLLGAAFGLKSTAAVFCVGAAVAVPLLPSASRSARALRVGWLALGGLAGGALTGGFWAWRLERLTGNPFFPYLNQIFESHLVGAHSFEYRRFLSSETLFWGSPEVINEELWALRTLGGLDLRYPLFLAFGIALLVFVFFNRRRAPQTVIRSDAGLFLTVFFCLSFFAWLKVFAIHRYLLPISLITPILIVFLVERLIWWRRVRAIVLGVVLFWLAATVDLFNLERVAWQPNPFVVDLDREIVTDDALVVMIDHSPTSYVIPAFPTGVRFVRPVGNLYLDPQDALHKIIVSTIQEHKGPIFTLQEQRQPSRPVPPEVLAGLALEQDADRCFTLRDRRITDHLIVCPAVRLNEAPSDG